MSSGEITVTLRLFAQLRQAAGEATIERRVAAGTTAGELAGVVLGELGLQALAHTIVIAVDGDFSDPAQVLSDGAWLSLVPPVSGGGPAAGAQISVRVTQDPLDAAAILAELADAGAGGTVLFQGTPREVDALEFEAHHELAELELRRIAEALVAAHGLRGIALHHRLGLVPVGESALLVAAASAHRGPAFAAAAEALDEIKRRVPIWKSEVRGEQRALVDGEPVARVRSVGAYADGAAAPAGPGGLTHVDAHGAARMVDVTDKAVTDRVARAVATVRVSPATAALIEAGNNPKGEVLATARLAGIMAAKRTAELVPLAHPLPLTKLDVEAEVDVAAGLVRLRSLARTTGRTGVEIEALTAVSVAALTVYDMIKAVEQHASIEGIRVVEKRGGRRDFAVDAAAVSPPGPPAEHLAGRPASLAIAAVIVSTSRTRGERDDRAGEALQGFAQRTGWRIADQQLVTDDRAAVAAAIRTAAGSGADLVLTLGGTGVTPDDVTPEATLDVIDRPIPGLAEALRATSLQVTPMAALSRGVAGELAGVLVLNLPGSPKALGELEPLLSAILPHAVAQLRRPVNPPAGALRRQ